jgi:tRNA pseudouridine55 synthase
MDMKLNQLNYEEGAMLLIDKPLTWTSFDVVKKVRSILKVAKIGHAGTLDPLATGLLILCTGQKTKQISYYQDLPKVYTGQLVLGKTTPSIDLETAFDSHMPYDHVTETAILELAKTFVGTIHQVPPAYSAIKIDGTRAYKKARKGDQPTLQPRQVTIEEFIVTSINLPQVDFKITCSKGTYIRSLVRDFGQQLGTGAYLAQLCRTQIGPYALEDAYDLETLKSYKSNLSDTSV